MKTSLREMSAAPLLEDEPHPLPPSLTKKALIWGYIFGAFGAALYSMKAVLIKLAYLPGDGLAVNGVDPITLMALRMGFALPVYVMILIWVLRRQKRNREGQKPLSPSLILKAASLGVLGYYLCAFLDFTGLKYITAQLERLILFTYPIFVILLGAAFFGARLTLVAMLTIGLAYTGIALVFVGGDMTVGENLWLGSGLVLLTAFLFAVFQLTAKGLIDKMGSELFTCISMLGAAVAIFTHFITASLLSDGVSAALDLPPRIFALGAAMGLISTILPSFLINIAMARIGAQAVASLGMLGPVATIIAAIILLGEPFGPIDALGTVLTITGIGLYTFYDRRAKASLKVTDPAAGKHTR